MAISEGFHPFPFRTRPLSPLEPMVLHGSTVWESRKPPGSYEAPKPKAWAFLFLGPGEPRAGDSPGPPPVGYGGTDGGIDRETPSLEDPVFRS